ncbi:MAG: MFS transporter [Dehalococcoidia bacterium]|nr:MFS transporter [Dehalococcoidia bacterium]
MNAAVRPALPHGGDAPARYRFAIEGSLLLLQFAMGLSFLAVAPLFPLIIDAYGVGRATASLLVGVTALAVALALVPCSLLAARLGPRVALAIGGLLMGAMALAPLASSFPLLLAARVLFALGASLTLGATPTVVMRWFPARDLAAVNGANVIAQSLGVTCSMLAGSRIAAAVGWDGALFAFASVTLSATALWLVVARDRGGAPATTGALGAALLAMPAILRDRATLLLGAGLAGGLGAFITLSSWLPTYYHEQFGFSLEKAGTVGGMLSFFGIVGSLLGSTLPVRLPHRRPFLITAGLVIPVAAFGCFASANPLLLYPSVVVLGVMGWIFMPVVFTIPMELPGMTPERVGIVVATVLGAGNLSGFVAPLFVGYLRDQTGAFSLGLGIASSLALVLALCGYLMPETGGRAAAALRHEGHEEGRLVTPSP